jgi:putative ABC transport system permease protein
MWSKIRLHWIFKQLKQSGHERIEQLFLLLLFSRPLNLLLNLVLFALGVGLISLLLLINTQVTEKMENNFAGIDLVIGAKGSPLQMVLCNMYHIDPPTGNISTENARPFLNPDNPLIGKAVPLSIGDNYKGFRIVGTNDEIIDLYEATFDKGTMWNGGTEVVIGSRTAEDTGLKLGDRFKSSHGLSNDIGMEHDDAADFVVVGILKKTNSVIDQLILCDTRAVWAVHDHDHSAEEGHDHEGHDHEGHDHEGHDHEGHDHTKKISEKPFWEEDGQEITALLVQFRNRKNFRALNLGRNINENTDLMAANPAYEVLKLQGNIGIGVDMMRIIAMIIVFVSALSVFFSLVNSLKERKYELALMRSMGASRLLVFGLIMIEGAFIALLGYGVGLLLSHGGMSVFADMLEAEYRYGFEAWRFLKEEAYMLFAVILIGLVAAVVPAIMASTSDISTTLSEE